MEHLLSEKCVKSKSIFRTPRYVRVSSDVYFFLSTFGLAFEEAADKTGARISLDSFEASVVQVRDNDIEHFVETLYYKSH